MPPHTPRATAGRRALTTVAAVAAAGLVGTAGVSGTAGAAPPGGHPAPDGRAAPTVGSGRTRLVTLPTGDRLAVGTDAAGRVRTVRPARPGPHSYLTEHLGADTYVIPSRALPTLGRSVSLSQFDVSALVAGRTGDQPGTVHPNFAMRTVTLTVRDVHGAPANALLMVVNVDDARKYVGSTQSVDGEVRISVPDGHYALMAYQRTYDSDHKVSADRLVFGRFTVQGGPVSHTVDLARATHRISVSTPKPAEAQHVDLVWGRGSSEGHDVTFGLATYPDHPIYLSTSSADRGVQHFYVREGLTSGPDVAEPYLYNVEFVSDRTIGADQHYRATGENLATVDAHYYSDKPHRAGGLNWLAKLPWEPFAFTPYTPTTQPLHRTEYLTANPELRYRAELIAFFGDQSLGGMMNGGWRYFRPGQKTRIDWLRGPIVPGIPADTGAGPYRCGACRIGDTLSIRLSPLTDSTPDHSGPLDSGTVSTSHFQLYQDGRTIADEKDTAGGDFTVPAARTHYRLVYDQTRIAPWTTQSTRTHTEWRFSSQHSGRTTVPADRWSCGTRGGTGNCSPVSLLLPRYQLRQHLDGSMPPGPDSLLLTLRHSPGAPRVPVEQASVAVSYDDGATWTPTTVSHLRGGTFRAHWITPASAAGGTVALRITAKDAAGATVHQVVHDALTVTAAGSRPEGGRG